MSEAWTARRLTFTRELQPLTSVWLSIPGRLQNTASSSFMHERLGFCGELWLSGEIKRFDGPSRKFHKLILSAVGKKQIFLLPQSRYGNLACLPEKSPHISPRRCQADLYSSVPSRPGGKLGLLIVWRLERLKSRKTSLSSEGVCRLGTKR